MSVTRRIAIVGLAGVGLVVVALLVFSGTGPSGPKTTLAQPEDDNGGGATQQPVSIVSADPNSNASKQGAPGLNRTPTASAPDVPGSENVPGPRVGPRVIARARILAPSNWDIYDIRVTVTNLSGNSRIGARDIRAVIIDCHRALNKKSLTIDEVFNIAAPPGGTVTATVGAGTDNGPAVLEFVGFNNAESAAFNLDPDTWEDSNYGATRAEMVGCRFEVVFDGTGSLRGDGVMALSASGAVVANMGQRNP